MPDHYFSENPSALSDKRSMEITFRGYTLRFDTDAGVFSKGRLDPGTELLLSALPSDFDGRALDLGCGWGAIGAFMARMWPRAEIILTDINERATELARANIEKNRLRADVLRGDGLFHIPGQFDLIATNPPIRAGKAVMYRLFDEGIEKLRDGGALYVVIRKRQGADSAKRFLADRMAKVETVARGGGFHVLKAT